MNLHYSQTLGFLFTRWICLNTLIYTILKRPVLICLPKPGLNTLWIYTILKPVEGYILLTVV